MPGCPGRSAFTATATISSFAFGTKADEPDEIGAFGQAAYRVTAGGGRLLVVGQYAPGVTAAGVWMIGLCQLDEDVPLPDWPMQWRMAENGYSPELVLIVPEDASVAQSTDPEPDDVD